MTFVGVSRSAVIIRLLKRAVSAMPQSGTLAAGVVLGLFGLAGHPFRCLPADHPGYARRLLSVQNYTAVTAACMIVERDKFLAVGGFDPEMFPVAFNDVDLCLKLWSKGWRSVWTPHALLQHLETATRPYDSSPARREAWAIECDNLRARWPAFLADDPCYHPAFSRRREDFSLRDEDEQST